MLFFIIGLVIFLIALGALVVGLANKEAGPIAGGIGGGILGFLVIMLASTAIVPAQQVGIPVTFGQPSAPLQNGFHFKAPWTDIILMDGTVQQIDNTGDHRTEIRLGNQSIAYVQNNIRWHIKPESATNLFLAHKEFGKIENALVRPEVASGMNTVLQTYNPLGTADGTAKSPDQISKEVTDYVNKKIGDRIVIDSITIPVINFDDATQNRINAYQAEIGNTRIAEQKQKTATAEAQANKILADSIKNDPNILVSKCLDLVADGKALPAGFQCWGGNNQGLIVQAPAK